MLIDAAEQGPLPGTLIIDFQEVFYTDVSGAVALRSLWHFTERYDVKISLARVHQHARETLDANGIIDDLGEGLLAQQADRRRQLHRLVSGGHTELSIDGAYLRVDRIARDIEAFGDLAKRKVGLKVGEQPKLGG